MPERKHNLTSRYERLDDQITGNVADSIAIHPRSHGRLHMPGEYSTDNRPPPHQVKTTSTATDNQGVYTEERLLGAPDHYLVTYDIWNHRDSLSFARIVLTDQADEGREDTRGGKRNDLCPLGRADPPKPRTRVAEPRRAASGTSSGPGKSASADGF